MEAEQTKHMGRRLRIFLGEFDDCFGRREPREHLRTYPKKGAHTAGVQRQWCGNTGKIDNCVVAVHLAYVAGDFQCLLDSDLYLSETWAADAERRKATGIPEEVVYRKKTARLLNS